MSRIGRRTFLGASGALALLGGGARAASPAERVRVAVIGLRNRGSDLAGEFAASKNAEVVAVCDVDDAMIAKPRADVEKAAGKPPRVEKDFRKVLDDRSIDAVAVATPDHWHALMTVMACQAGKDVYCEKPASHDVVEGRRMVEAARKYGRVVQLGTQRRSSDVIKEAVAHVRSGELGTVGMARAWIHQKRKPIGRGTPGPVPPGVDYELWQGPAPDRPFMANRFHYNWHWFWVWGTGELGNNGVHGVDVARWGLGVDTPMTVASSGGKYLFTDDDQETPDTQIVTWEFPGACLVSEHRMWSRHGEEGDGFGVAFYGDKGTLIVGSKGWRVVDPDGAPPDRPAGGKGTLATAPHVENFLECVRSRKAPNAEIEIGHLSTRLCHLGNIAHRVGRKLTFDPAREAFKDAPEADKLLSREYGRRFEMPSQV
jgi:predicted dehydrogenase